jgi:hypothetical protein
MSTPVDHRRDIHIMVVGTIGVLTDLIDQTLTNQPDMQFIGHVEQWIDITAELGTQADVAVLEVETFDSVPEPIIRLISTFPHLRILMLTKHDNAAAACWLGLQQQQLCIASTQMLVDSIRQLRNLNSLQRF